MGQKCPGLFSESAKKGICLVLRETKKMMFGRWTFLLLMCTFSQYVFTTTYAFHRPFVIIRHQSSLLRRFSSSTTTTITSPTDVPHLKRLESALFEELRDRIKTNNNYGFLYALNELCSGDRRLISRDPLETILRDWGKETRLGPNIVGVLRNIEGIFSASRDQDRALIDFFVQKYLIRLKKYPHTFPKFLTSLKRLDYRWSQLTPGIQKKILEGLHLVGVAGLQPKEFTELIGALAGLTMQWTHIPETTGELLLNVFESNLQGTFGLSELSSLIYNLGKLQLKVPRNSLRSDFFLEITEETLRLFQNEANKVSQSRQVKISKIELYSFEKKFQKQHSSLFHFRFAVSSKELPSWVCKEPISQKLFSGMWWKR
jgi:hypothetical protein